MTTWKPEGYTSVSPYLICRNAAALIDFLVLAFDAVPLRRFERPDGSVMHAEVRIDDSVVMIGGAQAGWEGVGQHLHVYVPDADLAYRRAIQHGATSIQGPARKTPDDDLRGGVVDPCGNTWWVATGAPTG